METDFLVWREHILKLTQLIFPKQLKMSGFLSKLLGKLAHLRENLNFLSHSYYNSYLQFLF